MELPLPEVGKVASREPEEVLLGDDAPCQFCAHETGSGRILRLRDAKGPDMAAGRMSLTAMGWSTFNGNFSAKKLTRLRHHCDALT
jgi:hypothetical protein